MNCFLLRLLWPLALLHCIQASVVAPRPLIYGRDNAYYFGLPVYKLIKPGIVPPTTTTTTTTPAPSSGYPSDILDIAYKKLGLKKLPRIEDLGELIGTGDPIETIEYLRKRTGSDADIALMKQYMDTLHFEEEHEAEEEEEAEAEAEMAEKQDDDSDNDDDNTMDNSFDEDQTRENVSPTKAPEPQESMMQRFSTFLKQWTSRTPTPAPMEATPPPSPPRPVSFQPVFVVRPPPMAVPNRRPVLVRQPVPYHYPVPFRPVTPSPPPLRVERPTEVPSTTAAPKPHLNTPKEQELTAKELEDITIDIPSNLSPHIMQFAKLANISPVIVDRFLQRQPKLAALAKKVSTLALSQEQTQEMESQVLMAVHKALSQSEEMTKILEAAQTLK
ncbi:pollen-specific leucine-rich repeat extensin-like protein 2 [Drosophila serrata]|uniref:pollen-specific leucine-rich repeat extensin-like protein 2 n=1 Tax=Drosophila serrata TaxID=7274 RepID=UPI000A1D2BDB|nr:pollen-specific leucine-rich repeat extensin-like protein 2 [Drosophila serrata]